MEPNQAGDGWVCKIPDEEGGGFDHDWQWRHDWYGDPGVINGTATYSVRVCRVCGVEDGETPYEGEDEEFYDRQFD